MNHRGIRCVANRSRLCLKHTAQCIFHEALDCIIHAPLTCCCVLREGERYNTFTPRWGRIRMSGGRPTKPTSTLCSLEGSIYNCIKVILHGGIYVNHFWDILHMKMTHVNLEGGRKEKDGGVEREWVDSGGPWSRNDKVIVAVHHRVENMFSFPQRPWCVSWITLIQCQK